MVSKSKKRREERRNRRKSAGKNKTPNKFSKKKSNRGTSKNANEIEETTTPVKEASKAEQMHPYNTRSKAKKSLKIYELDCVKTLKYGLEDNGDANYILNDNNDKNDNCSFEYDKLSIDKDFSFGNEKSSPDTICSFEYDKSLTDKDFSFGNEKTSPDTICSFDWLDSTVEFNIEDASLERLNILKGKILADEDFVFEDKENFKECNSRSKDDKLPTNGNLKDFLNLFSKIPLKMDQLELITTKRPLTPVELNKLTKDTNFVLAGNYILESNEI